MTTITPRPRSLALKLPPMPEQAGERERALRGLAAQLVAGLTPVTALALAAAIDEAVADAEAGR